MQALINTSYWLNVFKTQRQTYWVTNSYDLCKRNKMMKNVDMRFQRCFVTSY